MFYVIGKSCFASFTSPRLVVSQACTHWQQARPARAESSRRGSKRSLMPSLCLCCFLLLAAAGGITVSIIAFVFTIKFLCELAARVVSFLQNEDPGRRGDRSIYDYVRGNYLDPRSCKVSWDWKEPQEVGQTMSFRVQVTVDNFCHPLHNSGVEEIGRAGLDFCYFSSRPLQLFYKNGQPFPAHRPVGLRVNITHIELALDIPVTQEVLQEPESNVVKVAFTVRKAGRYEVAVKLGGLNVAYSPYYKIFQPGVNLISIRFTSS